MGRQWKEKHGGHYNGFAWYRTQFQAQSAAEAARHVLHFGAVDEACTVWVNGQHVLDRPFPFEGNTQSWELPFEIDITEVLRFDGPNHLAVRVEDNRGLGGIWRSVYLERRGP